MQHLSLRCRIHRFLELGKDEFKTFKWYLQQSEGLISQMGFNYIPKSRLEGAERTDTVDRLVETYGSDNALKISKGILEKMNNSNTMECTVSFYRLKKKYEKISEGIGRRGMTKRLDNIYTELYITEGGSGEVNREHEVRQIETTRKQAGLELVIKYNDILKPTPGQDRPIRTVLTMGVAGIGKTVSVQKFILDWAEGNANQDIQYIFPFPFRELNLIKKNYSLVGLIDKYFGNPGFINFDKCKVLFIFDGLDECRLPLDFYNNECVSNVTEPTSVDVLLTNLIKDNLLPSALLWITTRPAAANQIPSGFVDQVTEVRGFNDPQKEEYFRKRFNDENLASKVINHIKTCKSIHIMCHIPVFCWISATVFEMLKIPPVFEIPQTLTQMYEHFLLIQTKTNPKELSQSDKDMILKLSKLAFQQLQKGNLIFYEEDLRECDIDVSEASEYSALCTEIFKEESGFYQEKVFSFVHLSIQEFLAAVHVLESCLGKEEHVFPPIKNPDRAVHQALKSENGHLDLFLRFLLGLSLESNQNLLQGLLTQTGSTTQSNEETVKRTVEYLSEMINKESSPERIINLFHCLTEIGANYLVDEIQTSLRSGTLSKTKLQPHQCSALCISRCHRYIPPRPRTTCPGIHCCLFREEGCRSLASTLKSNFSNLKKLDLSDNDLENAGVQLLFTGLVDPNCKLETLRLSFCGVTEEGCDSLASALMSKSCHLRELDLSNNDLGNSGVKRLSSGLGNPHCKLETLRLSGCLVTEEGCVSLVSALKSNPSHLKKLDLSYNHPGDSGVRLLSAGLEDSHWRLEKLKYVL
uniref:NACHT domain-containing protein n=1 Tax=Esox lucius TaxID=8010 RepID=A0AAY5KWS4_ESOLU